MCSIDGANAHQIAFHSKKSLASFSPSSVQFKSEINGAFLCKRHQKQHLKFWNTVLRSKRSRVRITPGAPLNLGNSISWRNALYCTATSLGVFGKTCSSSPQIVGHQRRTTAQGGKNRRLRTTICHLWLSSWNSA